MDNASLAVSQSPLLETKIAIPQSSVPIVSRTRLHDQLDQGLRHKLTIVSAPAGSGKTTLLAEWIAQRHHVAAWVALDGDDNDPIRFWLYVCAALQTAYAGVGIQTVSLLQSPQPASIPTAIAHLINDVSAEQQAVLLLLDDYHFISNPVVHESLTYLLDHAPPHLHVFLATRADPPLPLPRMRVRGQLGVLRAADLNFTHDEALAFFSESMGLMVAPSDVAALEARTEGWIAGLHLAALSLQGRTDVQHFLQSFTGSNRYVVDYLAEEVFQQQSVDMQRFLLETSLLARLTPSLCDAVTQTAESVRYLVQLERQVLIVPLDSERKWYRYHELFGSFLRNQLQQLPPDRLQSLHERASSWYASHDIPLEAVRHALASTNWTTAASLIEHVADPVLLRGESTIVQRWLHALPQALVRSRLQLCLVQCYVLLMTQQYEQLGPWLDRADHLLAEATQAANVQPGEVQRQRGQVATLHGSVAYRGGDLTHAATSYVEALQFLPSSDQVMRSMIAHNLANAQRTLGDVAGARATMAALDAATEASTSIDGLTVRASLQLTRGHLRAAAHVFRQLSQINASTLDDTRWLAILDAVPIWMGALLYEWNDLQSAAEHFRRGMEQAARHTNRDLEIYGQLSLAQVHTANGDRLQARSIYEQTFDSLARAVGTNLPVRSTMLETPEQLHSALHDQVLTMHARLAFTLGDLAAAEHWAVQHDLVPDGVIESWQDTEHLMLARMELAQGKPDRALRRIVAVQQSAEADERWRTYLEALVVQATIFAAQHDTTAALHTLRQAIALAEPEGYIRMFVDEGQGVQTLLATLRRTHSMEGHDRTLAEYIDDILDAYGAMPAIVYSHRPRVPTDALSEPLTEREMDVLRCMAQGSSNAEIADTLIVAVSTVRTHIKNVYGKLAVRNRVEAISAARELGLLE